MDEGVYFLNMVWWTKTYALATIFAGIVLLVTLILLLLQLKSYRRTQELQGFVRVVDSLQREDVRRARRKVYELEGKDIKEWTEEERWEAEIVCHNFNSVGDMLKKKLISKHVLDDLEWTIKRCWEIVQPMIEEYRDRPHPGLWKNFQWLAEDVYK